MGAGALLPASSAVGVAAHLGDGHHDGPAGGWGLAAERFIAPAVRGSGYAMITDVCCQQPKIDDEFLGRSSCKGDFLDNR